MEHALSDNARNNTYNNSWGPAPALSYGGDGFSTGIAAWLWHLELCLAACAALSGQAASGLYGGPAGPRTQSPDRRMEVTGGSTLVGSLAAADESPARDTDGAVDGRSHRHPPHRLRAGDGQAFDPGRFGGHAFACPTPGTGGPLTTIGSSAG